MAEYPLRDGLIVQGRVAQQSLLQIFAAHKAVGGQHLGDAPVEAFDHAVGLGVTGTDQAMFDAVGLAELIERVFAGWGALAAGGKAVGELFAIVGQNIPCMIPLDYIPVRSYPLFTAREVMLTLLAGADAGSPKGDRSLPPLAAPATSGQTDQR